MRMFVGVAAALTLAGGVAVAAASLAQKAQEPGVWVSKDGARTAIVGGDLGQGVVAIGGDDDELGEQMRKLAVLAGRGAQLGVSVRDLDAEQAKTQGGAVVEEVRVGSAADKSGIKKGDLITEFDGERVRGVRHLTRLVTETPDGRTVKAAVVRDGKRLDLSVTPDAGSLASADSNVEMLVPPMRFEKRQPGEGDMTWAIPRMPEGAWTFKGGHPGELFGFKSEKGRLGVRIQELEGQLAEYFGTSTGVLVNSVDADSPAARAGLKAGDVVTAVNGKAVAEPSELIDAVRAVDDGATLTIDYTRDKKAQSTKATLPAKEPVELPRKRQSPI